MSSLFWLRAETKTNEFRRALSPIDCKKLIQAGHQVIVEDWKESVIPISEYIDAGCETAKAHSWSESPLNAIVVGLKALDDRYDVFKRTHIYFAHAYKEQDGWKELLTKFQKGGGKIIDLEFMLDENKRRVCAFGYWAGYVGAGLGALFSKAQNLDLAVSELKEQKSFLQKQDLIHFIQKHTNAHSGQAIVIGANGRCGSGAQELLRSLDWEITPWDRKQTYLGGPFSQILDHDLFVNCVLAMSKQAPFINQDLLTQTTDYQLNTISDVSCDPDSECNMVPLYSEATTLESPYIRVENNSELKLTAIDNLPSILPRESSFDFSDQLHKHLIDFNLENGPLKVALDYFDESVSKI